MNVNVYVLIVLLLIIGGLLCGLTYSIPIGMVSVAAGIMFGALSVDAWEKK